MELEINYTTYIFIIMKLNYQTPALTAFDIDVIDVNSILCQSLVLPGLEEDNTLEWDN